MLAWSMLRVLGHLGFYSETDPTSKKTKVSQPSKKHETEQRDWRSSGRDSVQYMQGPLAWFLTLWERQKGQKTDWVAV